MKPERIKLELIEKIGKEPYYLVSWYVGIVFDCCAFIPKSSIDSADRVTAMDHEREAAIAFAKTLKNGAIETRTEIEF